MRKGKKTQSKSRILMKRISFRDTIPPKKGLKNPKKAEQAYDSLNNGPYKLYRAHIKSAAMRYLKALGLDEMFFRKVGTTYKFDPDAFSRSEPCKVLTERLSSFRFDVKKRERAVQVKTKSTPVTFLVDLKPAEDVQSCNFYKKAGEKPNARAIILEKLRAVNAINSGKIPCIYCLKLIDVANAIDLDHLQPKFALYLRMAAILYFINKVTTLRNIVFGNPNFNYCFVEATVEVSNEKEGDKKPTKEKVVYYPSRHFKVLMFNERRNLVPSCKKCNENGKRAISLDKFRSEIKRDSKDPFHAPVSALQHSFDHNGLFSLMGDGTGQLVGEWFMPLYIQTAKRRAASDKEKAKLLKLLEDKDNVYAPELLKQVRLLLAPLKQLWTWSSLCTSNPICTI